MPFSDLPEGFGYFLPKLDGALQALKLAQDACDIPPVKVAIDSAVDLLDRILRGRWFIQPQDWLLFGLAYADACQTIHQIFKREGSDEIGQPAWDAIEDVVATLARVEKAMEDRTERSVYYPTIFHGWKEDGIEAWKQDLARALQVFTEAELRTNPYVVALDIHQKKSTEQEGASGESPLSQVKSVMLPLGEPPPLQLRSCFGHDKLIEKVVKLARILEPVALIGEGGTGKTSVALAALHHDQIKGRFWNNRRFIRCDEFPATRAHFLARLSKVVGAGIENPEDLTTLQPFLSSKEIIIILDNAEFILDPQRPNTKETHSVVEELCQLKTISLLITSRPTKVPPRFRRLPIPKLSMKAACDIFYDIQINRSRKIRDLLRRLDFHPLSITLLAAASSHNTWNYDRLAQEWGTQQVKVLPGGYNKILVTTIELSLASPTFRSLGPQARDVLAVVAFFPLRINEKHLDWLLPTIPNRKNMFDTFCALYLTHRSNGFLTMLTPIREYLSPRDPQSSPLLCATMDFYTNWLSVDVDLGKPGFEEARWITLEDANVERLLGQVRNYSKQKRLLAHTLELERRSENTLWVGQILVHLSGVNRLLGLHEEGIQQADEALEIYEQRGGVEWQAQSLIQLAWLFFDTDQLGASENAASRAIDLVTEKGQEYLLCQLHRVLGKICYSKGEKTKAVHHFESALAIASPPNWHEELFWTHHSLAELFGSEDEFNEANAHIEEAKSHAVDDVYTLGRAMDMQANIWCLQRRIEDAKSEALQALGIYKKCGAVYDMEACRDLLRVVERAMEFL